jgi:ABC-type molybdate transport system permease subunit
MPETSVEGSVALEVKRWLVFLFVLLPLLPVAIVSAILGATLAVARSCFEAGASVLDVWGD